jgi:hypothetical protein
MSGELRILQEALDAKTEFKNKWIGKFGDKSVDNRKYKSAEQVFLRNKWKSELKKINISKLLNLVIDKNKISPTQEVNDGEYFDSDLEFEFEVYIDVRDIRGSHMFKHSNINRAIQNVYTDKLGDIVDNLSPDSDKRDDVDYIEDNMGPLPVYITLLFDLTEYERMYMKVVISLDMQRNDEYEYTFHGLEIDINNIQKDVLARVSESLKEV